MLAEILKVKNLDLFEFGKTNDGGWTKNKTTGEIYQWGHVIYSPQYNYNGVITFPKVFSTTNISIFGSTKTDGTGWRRQSTFSYREETNKSFRAVIQSTDTNEKSLGFSWCAIGY